MAKKIVNLSCLVSICYMLLHLTLRLTLLLRKFCPAVAVQQKVYLCRQLSESVNVRESIVTWCLIQ